LKPKKCDILTFGEKKKDIGEFLEFLVFLV
jgi:hypothetical protein